ncbi:hypothetical protein I5Q34_00925 [Streptomyces sp. AV19]|uniref:hypothetical protein n=1 Tax=Streptomyces sp. AV19 TaxID=2793068 RepID=UPI0018FEFA68|nr:hypothetical protein [Streptomyces sp. AV19]MBH1932869.1 hypothetical protein [Streptomyces sp. AV19]MDG4531547.1 hypothetical protein [Streptomyces sp. AV19]
MEAVDDSWSECVRIADVVIGREGALADGRYGRERRARFRTWGISPATGDALVRILIVLAVRQQQPSSYGGRALLVEAERALGSYRPHELFAGVPATGVDDADRVHVDALRLLVYSVTGPSMSTLERLLTEARQVLRRVVIDL